MFQLSFQDFFVILKSGASPHMRRANGGYTGAQTGLAPAKRFSPAIG